MVGLRTLPRILAHAAAAATASLAAASPSYNQWTHETFEGIPHPYDRMSRKVIPAALRVIRLNPIRDYTVLGDLANEVGWKHQDLLKKLERQLGLPHPPDVSDPPLHEALRAVWTFPA